MSILNKLLFYKGNENLKPVGYVHQYTKHERDEYIKCSMSFQYFADNYVYILTLDHGYVLFKMFDYQKRMIQAIDDNRYTIILAPRQVGKTEAVVAYILWKILFTPTFSAGIAAHAQDQSIVALGRLKSSYERLPFFLQQGVKTWNKKSIRLENDSRVVATATSSSGLRGSTINFVYLDEFAHVESTLADDFFTSTYPVLLSGKNTKIVCTSCVSKDTYVYTPDGPKQMGDYVDYDMPKNPKFGYTVSPYSVHGQSRINHGKVIVNSGIAETVKISSSNSDLTCSKNHKVYACKKGKFGWYKSEDLSIGDYISIKYGFNTWGNNDDLTDIIPIDSSNHKNSFSIPKKMTRELAYIMGLYIAEGSIYKGMVTITCGDDISKRLDALGLRWHKYDDVHYHISSVSFVDFLRKYGISPEWKAKTKRIPKRLFKSSKEICAAFLSGYFDGDGCATARGSVACVSVSEGLIDDIRALLMNFGCIGRKDFKISRPSKKVKVSSEQYVLELTVESSRRFFNDIGFWFDRKQVRKSINESSLKTNSYDTIPYSRNLLEEIGAKYSKVGIHKENNNFSREFCLKVLEENGLHHPLIKSDLKWEKIRKLEYSSEEVFDFSLDHIEGDEWCHSVAYNGIIGHQTPNGHNHFYRMWNEANNNQSNFVPVKVEWNERPGRDAKWREEQLKNMSEDKFLQEMEGEFLGSSNTLISPSKLRTLTHTKPISIINDTQIWENPIPEAMYVTSVDVARGVKGDYSVATVIRCDVYPYKVVAKYRSNQISQYMLPKIVYDIGRHYNDSYVLIETNDVGDGVARFLQWDLEYENLIFSYTDGKGGLKASGPFKNKAVPGLRVNQRTKRIGCSNLKSLIESHKLVVQDFEIISELSNFVSKGNSYEANKGSHDDIVMTLVNFSYITDQEYFISLSETHARRQYVDSHSENDMKDVLPFGYRVSSDYYSSNQKITAPETMNSYDFDRDFSSKL